MPYEIQVSARPSSQGAGRGVPGLRFPRPLGPRDQALRGPVRPPTRRSGTSWPPSGPPATSACSCARTGRSRCWRLAPATVAQTGRRGARTLPRQRVEPRDRGSTSTGRGGPRSSWPAALPVRLPRLGEGECGIVYDFEEERDRVLKLAKPRPYSREHLREECELTAVFAGGCAGAEDHRSRPLRALPRQGTARRGSVAIYDPLAPRQPAPPPGARSRRGLPRAADGPLRSEAGVEDLRQPQQHLRDHDQRPLRLSPGRRRPGALPRLLAVPLRRVLGRDRPEEDRAVPRGRLHCRNVRRRVNGAAAPGQAGRS